MATQWTAGLGDGVPLPATTLNRIGAEWETWTPNFRAETGAWTSSVLQYARYGRIQKIVFGMAYIQITNFGTGNNAVIFDLPVAAKNGSPSSIGFGREAQIAGNTFVVYNVSTTTAAVRYYNNGATANNNNFFPINFVYEAA